MQHLERRDPRERRVVNSDHYGHTHQQGRWSEDTQAKTRFSLAWEEIMRRGDNKEGEVMVFYHYVLYTSVFSVLDNNEETTCMLEPLCVKT